MPRLILFIPVGTFLRDTRVPRPPSGQICFVKIGGELAELDLNYCVSHLLQYLRDNYAAAHISSRGQVFAGHSDAAVTFRGQIHHPAAHFFTHGHKSGHKFTGSAGRCARNIPYTIAIFL